jgi:hypothetical protein
MVHCVTLNNKGSQRPVYEPLESQVSGSAKAQHSYNESHMVGGVGGMGDEVGGMIGGVDGMVGGMVGGVGGMLGGVGRDLRLQGFIEPKFWVPRSLDFWT